MKDINEYGPVLTAKDVAEIMGVSLHTVYEIMRQVDFPLLEIGGKRTKKVKRDSFIDWLNSKERKKA